MSVIREVKTKIVGVTKQNDAGESIQELLDEMDTWASEGDMLYLAHDSQNQYDSNAIKVFYKTDHIGYINSELAAEIVQAVDDDCVQATLVEITGGDDLTYGCNILLRISDEPLPYIPPKKATPDIPDGLIEEAKAYISGKKGISIADLQKKLSIGYTQAAALMDKLEELGCVGPFAGAKPRQVLMEPEKTGLFKKLFGK